MCGIVGYIGMGDSKDILLNGLEKLEYRGYDSAGLAIVGKNGLKILKEKGRISNLRQVVGSSFSGLTGIGHTRWATHGSPSKENAHPHQSRSNRFSLVHNGVIENYQELKEMYLSTLSFQSETDSEVIVQLVEFFVEQNFSVEDALRKTIMQLKGSYALVLLDKENPNILYVAKNKSPILIGVGDDCNVITSDALAMLQVTNQFVELMDQEMVIVTKEDITIKDLKGNLIQRKPFTAELDALDIEKGTYDGSGAKIKRRFRWSLISLMWGYAAKWKRSLIKSGMEKAGT